MSHEIPNLWPPIETSVVSPVALLRHQASQLTKQTSGIVLEGEVKTSPSTNGGIIHEFRVIAPALDGYAYDLFKAWHGKDLIYPVTVGFAPWKEEAEQAYIEKRFPDQPFYIAGLLPKFTANREASSPAELVGLLRDILQSSLTKSVVSSLISRINDSNENPQPTGSGPVQQSGDTAPG